MLTLTVAPSRILVTGRNADIGLTIFQNAAGLLPCRCPDYQGSIRSALPRDPSLKRFDSSCPTCGGAGLNRHVEAA